jgi:type IV pilus assembly protein PilC
VPLPLSTRMLIAVSNVFGNPLYLGLMAGVVLVIGVVFYRFKSTPSGRRAIDAWMLRMPVFGRVIRLNLFGQFARTLGTLLQNGVSVLAALRIVEEVISNVVVKEAIAQTRAAVTDGKTLAEPLARGKVFPQLMIDLLRIGEETGDVPGALQNVANTYENELTISLRVMTNLIEPAMIILMALGVGLLLFSVLSAMFTITSNIGVNQR